MARMRRRANQDPRRRSAWRVLVPPLLFAGVLLTAVVTRQLTGDSDFGTLVLSGGIGLIALWSLYDGLGRALGRPRYLGTGRGIDRLLGLVQTIVTAGIALALLPNAVALLNLLARLATGSALP
jgi:hypothetical protein